MAKMRQRRPGAKCAPQHGGPEPGGAKVAPPVGCVRRRSAAHTSFHVPSWGAMLRMTRLLAVTRSFLECVWLRR